MLVKLRQKQAFEAVRAFVRNGLEAGAQRILPDQLEGPAKAIYNTLYADRPVDKFLIGNMVLTLPTGQVTFAIGSFVDYEHVRLPRSMCLLSQIPCLLRGKQENKWYANLKAVGSRRKLFV